MLIRPIKGTRILFEDGARAIMHEGVEATFIEGWRAVLAYHGLAPFTIVAFEHRDGGVGIWFLDKALERRGGSISELPEQMQIAMAAAVCPLMDGLWQAVMLSEQPGEMTEEQQAFFLLPLHMRMTLLNIYLRTFDSRPDCRHLNGVGKGAAALPVLDSFSRRVLLDAPELHWLSDPSLLQRHFDTLSASGHLLLHSPCGGVSLPCRKSLLLETDLIAYRMYDKANDLVFFLLAGGIFNHTRALYFPEANMVVSANPDGFRANYPDLTSIFHSHIAQHGEALFGYLNNEVSEPTHFWRGLNAIHLGHVLWNDYSGIERMLAAGPPPKVVVCETGAGPEMYGPLDDVFPELRGHVRREVAPLLGLTGSLYGRNALLFRTSAMMVTRALRERILAPIPQVRADRMVVLLGLRTENRTSTDLPGFCTALVEYLARGTDPVTLVIDGHNSRPGGGNIMSHGEHAAAGSPIALERSLVAAAQTAAGGTQVAIVSTIGEPLAASLAWARRARFFVAFWGAGLAKYRWVCNTPGFVVTNRWNLENLPDLALYKDPERMEAPSEMSFVSTQAVTDQPDAPVMIKHSATVEPSLVNFDIDLTLAMRDLDHFVSTLPVDGPI